MAGITDREQLWEKLNAGNAEYDAIIVGGVITGAGILREAARVGI